ncbi:MAG: glycosyltransferase family 4 protein [Alphaproteobacteria bacterium]|nr:glycosyltransferase family 4 protein [Alphaproteobacteria bacterium]MCB9793270.1 glycosyltransferase family 4 protein [Alphaproteobacteria bacterium]
MNVGLVHRRFTEHGGTERYLVGLARFLRDRGHEVHVYCNQRDIEEDGLRFHPLPMVKLGQAAKLLSLWRSSARAARGGHEVVMGFGRTQGHQVWRAGGGAHAAYLEACRPGWRLDPVARVERELDARAALEAKAVITPSELAAGDLVRHYGVPRARIQVLRNGVDSARFRPDPARRAAARAAWGVGEPPVIAFLGTGFERKGLATAIEVAARLDAPLVVMGRDRQLARWRRRHPGVRFMGGVADPERWLPGADVLLLPTRYEPYGNVCLEAMACGVPAVTTSQNGAGEVFPDPGLVADGVDGLTEATRRALLGGEALRRLCTEAARALTREACYAQVEQILLRQAELSR